MEMFPVFIYLFIICEARALICWVTSRMPVTAGAGPKPKLKLGSWSNIWASIQARKVHFAEPSLLLSGACTCGKLESGAIDQTGTLALQCVAHVGTGGPNSCLDFDHISKIQPALAMSFHALWSINKEISPSFECRQTTVSGGRGCVMWQR